MRSRSLCSAKCKLHSTPQPQPPMDADAIRRRAVPPPFVPRLRSPLDASHFDPPDDEDAESGGEDDFAAELRKLLTPSAGDAVAFYNYQPAGRGGGVALDRLALHAGLPAPSERRVAALRVA